MDREHGRRGDVQCRHVDHGLPTQQGEYQQSLGLFYRWVVLFGGKHLGLAKMIDHIVDSKPTISSSVTFHQSVQLQKRRAVGEGNPTNSNAGQIGRQPRMVLGKPRRPPFEVYRDVYCILTRDRVDTRLFGRVGGGGRTRAASKSWTLA